jgi:hypothetical protein
VVKSAQAYAAKVSTRRLDRWHVRSGLEHRAHPSEAAQGATSGRSPAGGRRRRPCRPACRRPHIDVRGGVGLLMPVR